MNQELIQNFAKKIGLKEAEDLNYFPKFLQIEPTSLCNARCQMCPIEEWTRDGEMMPDVLFDKIVEELKNYSSWIELVTIQMDGEPLIDKNLEKKIKTLKSIGIKSVGFASNASLMTEARSRSLIEAGLDKIDFSIDGAKKETFETIRRRLNFEKCIENTKTFIRVRDELKAKTSIRIRMAIQEANSNEFQPLIDYWTPFISPGDGVYGKLIHNWGDWIDGSGINAISNEELNQKACTSPFSSIQVFTDGRVPLCCCDYNATIEIGNVYKQTIQEIWQSEKYMKMRQMHLDRGRESIKMCRNCNCWDDSSRKTSV